MASGALDSSGQQHQDLEASVSSKLFNSGRPLRSFIDAGDSSDTSVQPPIDPEDDITQSRTANASAVKGNPLSSNFNAAAATPRTIQGNHEGDNGDAIVEYPPTSSQTSNSTPNSALSPSRHPHLLPQHANADPSSSSGGRSVNNSSGNSSFEYGGARQDRLAVNHPGSSDNAHYTIQSATNSNTGLLQPSFGDYDGGGPSTSSDMNTFTRVSGGKATAQVFGTQPVGVIGVHKPREIIRLDRDYTSGEICQFWSGFPLELEGRITATQHLNVMNELNAILASAFDPYKSIFDNVVAVLSLYLSTWLLSSHYDKEIARFDRTLEEANRTVYNPAGLNLINPKKNGYLFLELEYY